MNSLPYLIEGVKIVKTEESQSITDNSPNKKKKRLNKRYCVRTKILTNLIFMGCGMKPVKRQLLKFTKSDKTIRREARSRIPREIAVIFENFKFHAKLPSFHLNACGARSQIHIWSTPSIFGGLWAPLVSCMYFSEINGLKKPQLYNENKIFFLLKNIKQEKLYK